MAERPEAASQGSLLGGPAFKWSVIGLLALSLSLRSGIFQPTVRGVQVASDIVRRSAEYRQQIRSNDALEQEVAFLRTEPGRQWAVYRYLGMVKRGQEVGRVVEDAQPVAQPTTKPQRVRAWIAGRETASARCLHQLGQVAACYVKLRPLDRSPEKSNSGDGGLSKHAKQAPVAAAGKPPTSKP